MNNEDFGLEACYDNVTFYIECLHQNPFELLGKYIIRSKQEMLFNKTMIEAVYKYIEDHDIKWSDKL